ncbi:MerR family transcriptional regulator [Rhodococcus sp. NPDC058514]|uniref:MerR family transcriptional regulator n=1 Tax=unclassified Rhodococcus (in: high G+C Gram-positive bacteria) TaxID=192944 RepID=UPI003648C811
MRIGQLADAAGTTPRTVRHYHRLGLLEEPQRLPNGYREYTVSDAVRLMRIRWLADSGVPLGSVAAILSEDVSDEVESDVVADLRALISAVQVEQAKLARRHGRLASMLADAENGNPISALPADIAAALADVIDGAQLPKVSAVLRRERDLLEVLAISGAVPEELLAWYAAAIADDEQRERSLALLADWSDLEGRNPHSAEAEIEALSRRLLGHFEHQQTLADLHAAVPTVATDAGLALSLDDVIPDDAQREVVLRVQRRLLAGMSESEGV